jgi:hypothetical protein
MHFTCGNSNQEVKTWVTKNQRHSKRQHALSQALKNPAIKHAHQAPHQKTRNKLNRKRRSNPPFAYIYTLLLFLFSQ